MKKYFLFLTIIFTSCISVKTRYLQGDVIGFSDEVTTSYDFPLVYKYYDYDSTALYVNKWTYKGWDVLYVDEQEAMENYIETRIPRGEATTVYYAMELAAERIKYIRRQHAKHDPQTKFYIFLLTDGLDNGSPAYAKNEKKTLFEISSNEKYQERLQKKFKKAMGRSKNLFETYPMLWVGYDMLRYLKDNNLLEQKKNGKWGIGSAAKSEIEEQMKCFRYSSVGEAPELIYSSNYDTILNNLKKVFLTSNYTFRVLRGYKNKKIRMTFENEEGKKISLTGTLRKKGGAYSLANITFDNAGVTYLKTSQFCSRNGKNLTSHEPPWNEKPKVAKLSTYFTIEDLKLNGNPFFPLPSKIKQEIETGTNKWRYNSEYGETPKVAINTYFILVIDGSNSLDGKNQKTNGFEKEIDMAIEILDILTQNQL